MPGTLYVVATPIGNLEDLTFRALRTLKEVEVVAAEDTRRTLKLLNHYGVSKPLVSLHEHNEFREAPRLVERLLTGRSIALVSDAGTPAISDPGAMLVRLARAAGIAVVPVPGPSAITTALSVSGLSLESFVFMGFPPASGRAREDWMATVADEPRCVVFFEAPHRFERTMEELAGLANKPICIHRELTKRFEQFVRWPNIDNVAMAAAGSEEPTGEYVVIVEPLTEYKRVHPLSDSDVDSAGNMIGLMTKSLSVSTEIAEAAVASALGTTPTKLRTRLKKARYAKQARSKNE